MISGGGRYRESGGRVNKTMSKETNALQYEGQRDPEVTEGLNSAVTLNAQLSKGGALGGVL